MLFLRDIYEMRRTIDDLEKELIMGQFKVGDSVAAYGNQGVVILVSEILDYSVICDFHSHDGGFYEASFTGEGKENVWHNEPVLKKVSNENRI